MKIFVSYSAKYNKEIAGKLKEYFEEYPNVECFVAHDDILQGSTWEQEILDNLNTCDYFLPIQTENLTQSFWCQQEAGIAFSSHKKIIPLIPESDECAPVGFYARFQGFKIKEYDLRGSVKRFLIKEKIIEEGNHDEIEKRKIVFAGSQSFASACTNAEYLCELQADFTDADILDILDITLGNNQICNSYAARPTLKGLFQSKVRMLPKEKIEILHEYELI